MPAQDYGKIEILTTNFIVMRKLLLSTILFLLCAISLNAQTKGLYLSATGSYDLSGMLQHKMVDEVSLDYMFSNGYSLGIDGLYSNTDDKTWGVFIQSGYAPKMSEKFLFVPTIGIGTVWGTIDDVKRDANFAMTLGVDILYNVDDSFYCGLTLKDLYVRKNKDTLLLGIKFGIRF
jgi:hypothetical protein